ncbi:MAG: DNA-3-methyladenine glycosylase [Ignavibacteria bacterium]|nr:DNA-3-methyladenine glycosylase [Ignavibacteria bacterium]
MNRPLSRDFYIRDTLTVAKELLGKIIVKRYGKLFLSGKIVEVEAYIGSHDPACHAYMRTKGRCEVMYAIGGTAYVYFVYGNHYCFNVVTGAKGEGNAVLVRAVEPLEGIETMKLLRGIEHNLINLTNGPGKFCKAFDIDMKDNGRDLVMDKNFFITENYKLSTEKIIIMQSGRIGINKGKEFPYRFFIYNNNFVSKHKINETAIRL